MKKGVLLLNMGGPNNIDEVEMFLRNMFADKRILPMNSFMRKFIGNIIVKKRLHEAQENYRAIGGKSPLTELTLSLSEKVEKISGLPVLPAMRYVPPLATDALSEFRSQGVDEIILFPMYPHYSTTTTLSSLDDIEEQCKTLDYSPKVRTVEPYGSVDKYVEMQVESILESLGEKNPAEYALLISAHGLPMNIIESGDPYRDQIEANVSMIRNNLAKKGISFKTIELVYQSKVGGGAWLEPNLADVLRKPKHLKVLIYPIAFTIDNSETIFELDIEHREIAEKIGYEDYIVAKCPNDSYKFAEFIHEQINSI